MFFFGMAAIIGGKTRRMTDTAVLREAFANDQRGRGLAASTVHRRDGQLRRWLDWCEPAPGVWAAGPGDVRAWLDSRRMGPAARAGAISDLHELYRWAITEEATEVDPTVRVRRPRLAPGMPRPISEGAYAAAVLVAPAPMRAALLLAGMAGLRCCELSALRWADVDLAGGWAAIEGKGGRTRWAFLHPVVAEALAELDPAAPWVFASAGGGRTPTSSGVHVGEPLSAPGGRRAPPCTSCGIGPPLRAIATSPTRWRCEISSVTRRWPPRRSTPRCRLRRCGGWRWRCRRRCRDSPGCATHGQRSPLPRPYHGPTITSPTTHTATSTAPTHCSAVTRTARSG